MEFEARSWTAQLSRAESDISHASQRLEKVFKEASTLSLKSGGTEIPDPVKLVRRLTALEIAIGSLKNDCEAISTKRKNIVKEIIETQSKNVSMVQEMLIKTRENSNTLNETRESKTDDQSWNDLTQNLKQQHDIMANTASLQ